MASSCPMRCCSNPAMLRTPQGDPGLTPAGSAWLEFLLGALGGQPSQQHGATLANLPVRLVDQPARAVPVIFPILDAAMALWLSFASAASSG